jgi:uncharacterized small protein (DUF1192 family)
MVRDTGIGIAKEKISTVFEAFNQGDMSATRKYEGTGLGLTLVKHLVEAHGGTVWVDSVLGIGTEMTFTLPLWSPQGTLHREKNTSADGATLHDDDASNVGSAHSRSKNDAGSSLASSVSSKSGTTVTKIDFGLPKGGAENSSSIMDLKKQNIKLQADVDQLTRELARARTLAYTHGPLSTPTEGDEDVAAHESSAHLKMPSGTTADLNQRIALLQEELAQRDRMVADLRSVVDNLSKSESRRSIAELGLPSHKDKFGKFEIMSVDDNNTNQVQSFSLLFC